ncbi:hypothetical protein A3K93_07605 [Acinetobacter sp. NCu2D-2]|uniref:hypothetical protein n=1 Tax=Acinetobacter sp. NCu2D-2 TaxID=1608473 RepID=UPI0007CDD6BD|nr:hypothetical protein [Acinetobacter sp. NCu2D-2]ANF82072.1 hypothetical protein A3K93_07605 [Acinetobacter sp. NCu2D-2]
MRKLKFMANNSQQSNEQSTQHTQDYVAKLLAQDLEKYGFKTLPQSGSHIAVSVEEHELPLSISCEHKDSQGHLVCEISSYPEEEQDWLDRITEQSLLNQLAQAVENTLKEDEKFSDFEWKYDQ